MNQQKNTCKIDYNKKSYMKKEESIHIFVKKVNL